MACVRRILGVGRATLSGGGLEPEKGVTEIAGETDRLRLRQWGEGDGERFYEVMNTPAVMRHLGGVQDLDAWRAALDRLHPYQRDFGHTFWLVERRHDDELLGFCGLKRVNAP